MSSETLTQPPLPARLERVCREEHLKFATEAAKLSERPISGEELKSLGIVPWNIAFRAAASLYQEEMERLVSALECVRSNLSSNHYSHNDTIKILDRALGGEAEK